MANNYTQISEVVGDLTDAEMCWLKGPLEIICVIDGKADPTDELPAGRQNKRPEWRDCRGLRNFPDYDPEFIEEPEFQFKFETNDKDGDGD